MMNRIFMLLAAFLIIRCVKDDQLTVVNIHKNWKFKQLDDTTWKSATVPGNVYSDLLNHKKIPDPFVSSNELNVQWASKKSWNTKLHSNLTRKH